MVEVHLRRNPVALSNLKILAKNGFIGLNLIVID